MPYSHCLHPLFVALALSLPWASTVRAQSARHTDAHADRVILSPTAETQPAGELFITSYEIIAWQVGFAPSDRLHFSLAGLTDFSENGIVELNVKTNLHRSAWIRLAATSGIDYLGSPDVSAIAGRIGGTAQICFEPQCRSSLSLSAMVAIHNAPDVVLPLGTAAGITARVSDDVSLLLETSGIFNASQSIPFIDLPIFALGYGVRISGGGDWSLDLALVREMASDEGFASSGDTLFDLLGLPLVAFTYRFGL